MFDLVFIKGFFCSGFYLNIGFFNSNFKIFTFFQWFRFFIKLLRGYYQTQKNGLQPTMPSTHTSSLLEEEEFGLDFEEQRVRGGGRGGVGVGVGRAAGWEEKN